MSSPLQRGLTILAQLEHTCKSSASETFAAISGWKKRRMEIGPRQMGLQIFRAEMIVLLHSCHGKIIVSLALCHTRIGPSKVFENQSKNARITTPHTDKTWRQLH